MLKITKANSFPIDDLTAGWLDPLSDNIQQRCLSCRIITKDANPVITFKYVTERTEKRLIEFLRYIHQFNRLFAKTGTGTNHLNIAAFLDFSFG
ncbi:hypothetical protein SDC9_121631 [bioreactor metagenome]|uniref:Uncharacterized protein n=1 Tax=bioreactor metagenome TaxID=1076179 RepID=A0A645CCN7_9ZZZZ